MWEFLHKHILQLNQFCKYTFTLKQQKLWQWYDNFITHFLNN